MIGEKKMVQQILINNSKIIPLNSINKKKNSNINKNRQDNVKNSFLIKDELFNAGLIFLVFSLVTSGFNYLYQVFMGRILGPVDYGILGSLFAIVYIVSFSSSPFNLVISKSVAEYRGKNEKQKIKKLFRRSLFWISIFSIVFFIIYLLLVPLIAKFMNLNSNNTEIIIVGFIAVFSFISVIFSGTLNGLEKFVWQNCSNFSSALFKLIFGIVFVLVGFSLNGALGAILFGTLFGMLISYIPLRKEFKGIKEQDFDAKKAYLYAIPVFISSIIFIFIITLDQILVKHFFSSADAGIYAAAGMIGKIVWFSTAFLIGPLFPKVVRLKAEGKSPSKLLINALIYISLIIIAECIVFFIAPTFVVNAIYGKSYLAAVPLIGILGIALGIFSLIQIFMTYNLAIEKYNFIYLFLIGIIIEIIGIYFYHSSLLDIVKIVLITTVLIFISMIIYNRKDLWGENGS